MKNKSSFFISLALSIALLSACSEELDQPSSDIKETQEADDVASDVTTTENESSKSDVDSEDVVEEQINDMEQANESEKAETETKTSEEDSKEPAQSEISQNVQQLLNTVDNKVDYYEFYTENATSKDNSKVENEQIDSVDEIIYEQASEDLIQLPLLKDNEAIFEEKMTTITLNDLDSIDAITYVEEPLTRGYLIDIDLNKVKEHYFGKSYSLHFRNNEYGLYISEESTDYAFVFIREEVTMDTLRKEAVVNILN